MTQAKPRFTTFEEYLNYDDGSDRRYELVDGELIELPAESDLNVLIATFLTVMLSQHIPYYLIRRGTEIFVRSRAVTSRYPDLVVLTEAGDAALSGATRSAITFEIPAPALVVEVVSPGSENYNRDYVRKTTEYASRSIPEYWLIDPSRSVVIVLVLERDRYREVGQFKERDRVLSPTFPNLQLTAEQILKAGR